MASLRWSVWSPFWRSTYGVAASLFIVGLLQQGCANIRPPEGGDRDTIPPQLIRTIPQNEALNFNGDRLVFEFDEQVDVTDFRRQVLITPLLKDQKLEYKVKRNRVTLLLEEPYPPNTTVVVNLGESIEDLTEQNAPRGLKLVYATGSYLDSMRVDGKVYDAYTKQPAGGVVVSLYGEGDTTSIDEDKPTYYAVADEEGQFSLTNLRNDRYRIYALGDADANLIFNEAKESIAFADSVVDLTQQNQRVSLRLIKADERPTRINRITHRDEVINIKFNKPQEIVRLSASDSSVYLSYSISDPDQITLFRSSDAPDSTVVTVVSFDSVGTRTDTAVTVSLLSEADPADTLLKAVSIRPHSYATVSKLSQFELELVYPLINSKEEAIVLINDTTARTALPNTAWKISPDRRRIQFVTDRPINAEDTLLVKAYHLTMVGKRTNTADTLVVGRNSAGGRLSGRYAGADTSIVIELIRQDGTVVRSYAGSIFDFDNLPAGNYGLRAIVDTNGNGRWDRGSFRRQQLPEQVYYYRTDEGERSVSLKSNWEINDLLIMAQDGP
ncbi:MAG: Ig-like domain-containing protein [Catalinimonas sp.]